MHKNVMLAGAGIAGMLLLTGCGLQEALTEKSNGHVKNVGYPTGTEGKNDQDAKLPSWVPDQASAVTEAIRTTGMERILRFTSTALPATCVPSPASKTAATLTAGWWPDGTETRTNQVCDGWHVRKDGDTVFAFKPETVAQTSTS